MEGGEPAGLPVPRDSRSSRFLWGTLEVSVLHLNKQTETPPSPCLRGLKFEEHFTVCLSFPQFTSE